MQCTVYCSETLPKQSACSAGRVDFDSLVSEMVNADIKVAVSLVEDQN